MFKPEREALGKLPLTGVKRIFWGYMFSEGLNQDPEPYLEVHTPAINLLLPYLGDLGGL